MKPFRLTPGILLTLALGSVLVLCGMFSATADNFLQFDRSRIDNGEWWRLLSGQLVHYGIYHLLMNLAALLVCGYAFLDDFKPGAYACVLLFLGLCVGFGIYWGNPELEYYRGLSGALHGLIIFSLLITLKQTPFINITGLLVVVVKIWHEQQSNYQATSWQQLMPVPVVVDAHLYGAISGFFCALIYFSIRYFYLRNPSV
jgi:rhomboid family GlyGly-CTERM serine protease